MERSPSTHTKKLTLLISKLVAEVGVEPRMAPVNVQVADSRLPPMPKLPRMPPHVALNCPYCRRRPHPLDRGIVDRFRRSSKRYWVTLKAFLCTGHTTVAPTRSKAPLYGSMNLLNDVVSSTALVDNDSVDRGLRFSATPLCPSGIGPAP